MLAGGAENMSLAPFAVRDMRWGTKLGVDMKLRDTLWEVLTDNYIGCPMVRAPPTHTHAAACRARGV